MCKTDLKTGSTTAVRGSEGLYGDFAVSSREDRLVIASQRLGAKDPWGLFEVAVPAGTVRTILPQTSTNYKSSWNHLSVSPAGDKLVAVREGRLEIIDIARRTSEPLDERFFIASWSPDGRWLAALEKGENGRTILLHPKDLSRRSTLGNSEVDWSPDSRYLLAVKSCDAYHGTLQVIDIENGARTTVESSACQIDQSMTGWVRTDVASAR